MSISEIVSVFGSSGFVGSEAVKKLRHIRMERGELVPATNNILWLVSTVDNYNVYSSPTLDIETNQILLVRMLENARSRFGSDFIVNFVSSWFVYGNHENEVVTEESECRPLGFYSITKRAAELMLMSYCETFNARYRILRLGSIIGNGDRKMSLKKNAFPFLVSQIARDIPVEIYSTSSTRDLMDVRDCADAISLVVSYGELDSIYNIGNGESVDIKEMLYVAQSICNNGTITEIPVPEFHKKVQTTNFRMGNSKLMKLGYIRKFNTIQTIQEIIDEHKPTKRHLRNI